MQRHGVSAMSRVDPTLFPADRGGSPASAIATKAREQTRLEAHHAVHANGARRWCNEDLKLMQTRDHHRKASMAERTRSIWGKRVWVAGHRGMVGSAVVATAGESEQCTLLRRDTERARPDASRPRYASGSTRDAKPDAIVVAAATGRRHPRQRHLPGRFPLRQSASSNRTIIHAAHEIDVSSGCCSSARQLHLSPSLHRSADHRGRAAHRPPRADQRVRTRSPRSPASSWRRRFASSMAATTSRRCPPTSTGRETTST
jgi:hypothetical protein